MAITIGNVVGENSSTNSDSVDVTLTEDVPQSTYTASEGLLIVIETMTIYANSTDYTNAPNPTDQDFYPDVTDITNANKLMGRMIWVDPPLASITAEEKRSINPPFHIKSFRQAYFYQTLQSLSTGDDVTVDFSSRVGPHPYARIFARLHRVSGARGDGYHQSPGFYWQDVPTGKAETLTANFQTANPTIIAGSGQWDHFGVLWYAVPQTSESLVWSCAGHFTNKAADYTIIDEDTDHIGLGLKVGYAFYDGFIASPTANVISISIASNDVIGWGFTESNAGPGWPEMLHLENLL